MPDVQHKKDQRKRRAEAGGGRGQNHLEVEAAGQQRLKQTEGREQIQAAPQAFGTRARRVDPQLFRCCAAHLRGLRARSADQPVDDERRGENESHAMHEVQFRAEDVGDDGPMGEPGLVRGFAAER